METEGSTTMNPRLVAVSPNRDRYLFATSDNAVVVLAAGTRPTARRVGSVSAAAARGTWIDPTDDDATAAERFASLVDRTR